MRKLSCRIRPTTNLIILGVFFLKRNSFIREDAAFWFVVYFGFSLEPAWPWALSDKRVACLTKDVLQKMRNDTSFRSFCDVVLLKSKSYPSMSGPMFPRRTRAPRRVEIGTGEPTYPVTVQDYYSEYTLKLLIWWWTLLTSGLTSQALIHMQRWSLP